MKLTDYIAEFLTKEVGHIFVGNGGVVVHILDSMAKQPGLKVVPCENEQGAAIAAEAYARVTRNIGAAVATSGPGIINLLQGIACAYYDSIPVIYISGQVPTSQLKGKRKCRQIGFQEIDVIKIVDTLTKYAVLLTDPKRVRYELEKLIYIAKEGRPGPVLLDLPDDLQRAEINPDEIESFKPPEKKIYNIESQITEMKELIKRASRPVVIVGSGVKLSGTEKLAESFIIKSGIPVATTWATIDMFVDDFPLLIGNFGISANRYGNFAIQKADLIISLGSRLDTHETGSRPATFAPEAKKIVIDIDPEELNKDNGMNIDLKINCDLRVFLEEIQSHIIEIRDLKQWLDRIKYWKEKYPVCLPEYYNQTNKVNPYVFFNELSKVTKDGDIVITDAGATLTWTMQGYKIRKLQLLFSAFNHSPMGYSLPASIGAQYAAPDKQVVCITGDGGMNMNIQELETIAFNKLPVKIFIMNNGEYGIIKQTQDTWLNSRHVASDCNSGLGSPDFVSIAKAYKIATEEICNHDELVDKINAVLSYNEGPLLCDVKIRSGEKIIPKLVFGRPLEDLDPFLDREELKKNLEF